MIIISDWWIPRSASAVGTSSGLVPPSAAIDITRPYVAWRSTSIGVGTTGLQLDLGAQRSLTALVVDNVNVGQVLLQRSTDAVSWTTIYSGTIDIERVSGRRKLYVAVGATARYVRVLANTTTTDDGLPSVVIGAVGVVRTQTTVPIGGYPARLDGVVPQSVPDESGAMRAGPIALGQRRTRLTLSASALSASAWRSALDALRVSPGAPVGIYLDRARSEEVWIARIVGPVPARLENPLMHGVDALTLEEVA